MLVVGVVVFWVLKIKGVVVFGNVAFASLENLNGEDVPVSENEILKIFLEHEGLFFGLLFWKLLELLLHVLESEACWPLLIRNDGEEFERMNEKEFGLVKENGAWLSLVNGNPIEVSFDSCGVFTKSESALIPKSLKGLLSLDDDDAM